MLTKCEYKKRHLQDSQIHSFVISTFFPLIANPVIPFRERDGNLFLRLTFCFANPKMSVIFVGGKNLFSILLYPL